MTQAQRTDTGIDSRYTDTDTDAETQTQTQTATDTDTEILQCQTTMPAELDNELPVDQIRGQTRQR